MRINEETSFPGFSWTMAVECCVYVSVSVEEDVN